MLHLNRLVVVLRMPTANGLTVVYLGLCGGGSEDIGSIKMVESIQKVECVTGLFVGEEEVELSRSDMIFHTINLVCSMRHSLDKRLQISMRQNDCRNGIVVRKKESIERIWLGLVRSE